MNPTLCFTGGMIAGLLLASSGARFAIFAYHPKTTFAEKLDDRRRFKLDITVGTV